MRPRLVSRLVLATFVGLAWTSALRGQDISVQAFLSNAEVGLNQQFVLNVEITGSQQVQSDPELPDLSDFSIYLGSGTSTSMQIVNGRTTVSVTLQYRFQATNEGTFEIGPVRLRAGGRTFETEPLTITVSPGPPAGQRDRPGEEAAESGVGPNDLFVRAEVSRLRVYANEPIIVEYRLYTRVNVSSYSVTRLPSTAGFWAEEFPQSSAPQVEQVVRDGVRYATAVIRRAVLYPTGPGVKSVEPISVEAQVRVQRRSRDPFESIFGESPFGTRVPVMATSPAVEIDVLPLPEEGRPRDFSGFVGDLSLGASIDATVAETNTALSLEVRVEGEGNLRALPQPEIQFPSDFEVYPPEVSESLDRAGERPIGSRVYEYVLVPRVPGTKTIPSIAYSYFDPARRSYASATTDPIEIEVTGEAAEGPVSAGRVRGAIAPLREDIRFIRIAMPAFQPVGRSLFDSPGFWVVLVLPLVTLGTAAGYRRHRDRIEGDVAYARRRRASKLAKQRLKRAASLLSGNTQREFYAEVGRALQGFLGDRLNVAEAGIIRESVEVQLGRCGVADATVAEYLACLDECDRQRFAPSAADAGAMQAFLKRAERAMTRLAQELSA